METNHLKCTSTLSSANPIRQTFLPNYLYLLFSFLFFLFLNTKTLGYEDACPELEPPTGAIVFVDTEQEIRDAVNNATPGTTVLIADGTYNLAQDGYSIWIDTPDVTLRSQSGNRENVILDDNYAGGETITVAASNVTIANLTLMRAGTHPIHVVSNDSEDVVNTLIYNVHIIDPGQQAIKINPHAAKINFPDNGVVACSTIELTDAGRTKVWDINGSCYTGGVDGHHARGWVVRDNTIEGFWCENGLSEHGVHFWTGSRDTVVERNTFIDNARGIGFGLSETNSGRTYPDGPCADAVGYVGHYDGIIRNNFIFANRSELFNSEYGADGGIALAQACGARILHNTIAFTQAPFAAIEWRFSNTDAEITNNLTTHNLMDRGGTAALAGNLENQPLSLFEDGANGNLHLDMGAAVAIDQGQNLAAGLCDDDFDGNIRPVGSARDIGADEVDDGSGNTTPIANSQNLVVDENSAGNPITLSGSDPDGDVLTYTITSHPANGSLSGNAPDVTYTPQSDFTGSDSFTFTVNDGIIGSAEALVSITVEETGSSSPTSTSSGGGGCFIDLLGMP